GAAPARRRSALPGKKRRRYFFVHIMKAGGFTMADHFRANFGAPRIFPEALPDGVAVLDAYLNPRRLLTTRPEDRLRYRVFVGHGPFSVTARVPTPVTTVAMVRHPLERPLAYLDYCRRTQAEHHGLPDEEIYDDPWYFPRFIQNHQTKVFSM